MKELTTVSSICKEFDITEFKLLKILHQGKYQPVRILREDKREYINSVLTEEAETFVRKYFYDYEKEEENKLHEKIRFKNKPNIPANVEELKKQHPLVTDIRCFCEEWFPDISLV